MTPMAEAITFRIDDGLLELSMKQIWERDVIQVSGQLRPAVSAWVESKGVIVKPNRKRASSRKRT